MQPMDPGGWDFTTGPLNLTADNAVDCDLNKVVVCYFPQTNLLNRVRRETCGNPHR